MPYHLPDYAAGPLRRFVECSKECDRLVDLSIRGISMLRDVPRMLEELGGVHPLLQRASDVLAPDFTPETTPSQLELAMIEADFARRECDSGFPLLHAHTLIGLWGAFEAAIEDMVVGILMNEPDLLRGPAIGKIKMAVADFETLERDELMRALLIEAQRNGGSAAKEGGANNFESLLAKVGLSEAVDSSLGKNIWEIQNVRNCIVHRNAIADRHLVKNCPWLGLEAGDPVVITHQILTRYGTALCEYIIVLWTRLGKKYGVDVQARIDAVDKQRNCAGGWAPSTLGA